MFFRCRKNVRSTWIDPSKNNKIGNRNDFHVGISLWYFVRKCRGNNGTVLDKTKAISSETSDYAKRSLTARFIVGNASDAVTESHILKTIKVERIYRRGKLATSSSPFYFIGSAYDTHAEVTFRNLSSFPFTRDR